ncbi:MAG: type II toxin-antitoxin system PemK/MazF family toxin [Spirochaetales bacterium]|nr:type II toxin-antitoxin system PemK/MazF family toxin [Spirochaetales bacterium]
MIRGEIWWVDLGMPFGSEPGFKRPVIIIQDDTFNNSNIKTTIVLSITSNLILENAPGNVYLDKEESGLPKNSVVNVSQIVTIDKQRLIEKTKKISDYFLNEIEKGIKLVLGIDIKKTF